jgi:hypothetical protein
MLLNEARLRELYAAGEIDLAEFERGLDIVLGRNRPKPVSARAGTPLESAEREAQAERIAAAPGPRSRLAAARCPTCRSELRPVHEHGVDTSWCPGCNAYVGPVPHPPSAEPGGGGTIVGGGFFVGGGDLF